MFSARLSSSASPSVAHHAGDWRVAGEPFLLDQEFERPEAAAAGGHLEHAGLGALIVEDRPGR